MLFVLASAISISMPSESPLITLTTRPTASSGSPKATGMKNKTNNKAKRHIMTILSPQNVPSFRKPSARTTYSRRLHA
jgi:capsular polysaccharide biosynthesis protein